MMAIVWQRPKRPAIESPPPLHTDRRFTCATHIRGRIVRTDGRTSSGHTRYIWQVYNERTEAVLIETDAVGWVGAVAACSEAVYIARGARFWCLKAQGLR